MSQQSGDKTQTFRDVALNALHAEKSDGAERSRFAQNERFCLFADADGRIRDLVKGGEDCYHMYGISYWSAEDGAKLAKDLPREFEASDETKQRFWDDVPCVICNANYDVYVRECTFDDIQEIDSFAELQQIDPAYRI